MRESTVVIEVKMKSDGKDRFGSARLTRITGWYETGVLTPTRLDACVGMESDGCETVEALAHLLRRMADKLDAS